MASGGHKRKASTDLDDTSYPLIPFDDEHQDNNADNNNNNHHQTLPYNNNNNNNNNNNGCVVNGDEKKDDDIDYNFDFEEEEDGIDQDQENAFAELLKNVDCQQGIIVGNNNKLVIRGPHYYSDNSDGDEPFGKKPKLVTNTIIIDHCTIPICHPTLQNKAIEIKAILEKHVPNVTVKINPFGPIGRNNHFEIRIEGGPVLISLKDLRRPFLDVVDLNIKKLLANVKLILNC